MKTSRRLAIDTLAMFAFFTFIVAITTSSNHSSAEAARPSDLLAMTTVAGERTRDVVIDTANAAGSLTMVAIPRTSPAVEATLRNQRTMLFTLATVLSMLAALNLAFFRHLRRVHASPRSQAGARRG